ncbi:sulfate adenylyltransferase [Hoeflea sp. Naph1]|uniref:sulfate adenylyltransferase n=1 Tax=Hoeflea sp. Naph1 TaxID=3388653 RepID=UPI00399000C0
MSKELNFEDYPQKPHGGVLVNQVVPADKRDQAIAYARTLPSIRVDLEAVITIEMIATGVLSPNTGFMNQADYNSVLKSGRLADGTIWPVPLSFAPVGKTNSEIIKGLSVGDEVALTDYRNEPMAILKIEDLFDYDKNGRAQQLFGTTDRDHPGVDSIYRRMGDTSLAGPVTLLQRADWGPFEKIRREPKDTWRLFYEEKKFKSVAGFITGANPLHRGHEYIHKNALEEVDGLFVQPLVEMAKREYVRHEYRMLAYRSVLDTYYPTERTMMSPLRVTYIFAGPREAILHALIMKNYGCTHALIGRDHAGIGSYYDKYASHSIFDQYSAEELGIDIRLFHEVFYCTRCASHASEQTCPHDHRYRLNISGTGIREMLRHGILPAKEVVRPEAARIAIQGVQPKGLDEAGEGTLPVSKVVQSMYPYYRQHSRLGGPSRARSLEPEDLTVRDLEAASLDARANANRIYHDIYSEYSSLADHNLHLQEPWIIEARANLKAHQEMVLSDLQEKVALAPEEASDEFMYQDKNEAERELSAARRLLSAVPPVPENDTLSERVWNPLPYQRYRGVDE